MAKLAAAKPGVDRDDPRAERQRRKHDEQPFRAIAHQQADIVAPPDAVRGEAGGQAGGFVPEGAIGPALVAIDQEFAVRRAVGQGVQQGGKRAGGPDRF